MSLLDKLLFWRNDDRSDQVIEGCFTLPGAELTDDVVDPIEAVEPIETNEPILAIDPVHGTEGVSTDQPIACDPPLAADGADTNS